ncbi:MAG: hypothetical protein GY754_01515 [bacterium]|nr:hypothetical protein [bacterium]
MKKLSIILVFVAAILAISCRTKTETIKVTVTGNADNARVELYGETGIDVVNEKLFTSLPWEYEGTVEYDWEDVVFYRVRACTPENEDTAVITFYHDGRKIANSETDSSGEYCMTMPDYSCRCSYYEVNTGME